MQRHNVGKTSAKSSDQRESFNTSCQELVTLWPRQCFCSGFPRSEYKVQRSAGRIHPSIPPTLLLNVFESFFNMGIFSVIRITLFSLAIAFALIEVGINAYFIWLTEPYYYFIFSALGVATAALTLLTIPVMLIVDFVRRGAFTSMIVFELSWLFILAILWVATAGEAVDTFNLSFPEGCIYVNPTVNGYCMEVQAVEAFAFLNFFIFMGYTCTLLVFSIIATSRGNSVWTYSVKESTFFAQKSRPAQQQVPLAQYAGAPATGFTGTPVSQPQQLGTYSNYSGTPAQSPQMQHQQFQPAYSGQQQGIPV